MQWKDTGGWGGGWIKKDGKEATGQQQAFSEQKKQRVGHLEG